METFLNCDKAGIDWAGKPYSGCLTWNVWGLYRWFTAFCRRQIINIVGVQVSTSTSGKPGCIRFAITYIHIIQCSCDVHVVRSSRKSIGSDGWDIWTYSRFSVMVHPSNSRKPSLFSPKRVAQVQIEGGMGANGIRAFSVKEKYLMLNQSIIRFVLRHSTTVLMAQDNVINTGKKDVSSIMIWKC